MTAIRARASGRGGFTLVEVMVVMGIIILAAAFTYPTIRNFLKNRKLDVAGRAIVNAMQEARSEAVTKRKAQYVVFLRRGLWIYDTSKQQFEGGFRSFSGDEAITYQVPFANQGELGSPELLKDELASENETDLRDGGEIYLRFDPTGTIEFGPFQDVSSIQFRDNVLADIVVEQGAANPVKGFIDVRAAGTVAFKIEEIARAEEAAR